MYREIMSGIRDATIPAIYNQSAVSLFRKLIVVTKATVIQRSKKILLIIPRIFYIKSIY